MTKIIRDPHGASRETYDCIILGGGIYGVTCFLEASLRGLKPLLLEKGDFGEFTSFNSLRIIHGGFRYLQDLNITRILESSGERNFYLRQFPGFVRPLPCLLPLYGDGLKKPLILLGASLLYELLCFRKNRGLESSHLIPPVRVIGAVETKKLFPTVEMSGLR